jgi:enoyl-CoA hydratase
VTYTFIELGVEDHVATLALNRTENLNAISLAFADEVTRVIRELNDREDVRVVILKSNARGFCSGLDLKDFTSLGLLGGGAKKSFHFYDKLHSLFDCCNVLEECRKPVIAAVHGMCVGGGLDIISACDIRLCSEDATFSLREAAIGFVADMGVLQRLPHIIGQGFTREMAYTARFYTAREVDRMGLINNVYPDKETLFAEAKKLAAQIAANAPLAVMATKEVLNYSRTASISDGMFKAIEKNAMFLTSKDIKEAATAFMEKRKPNFKGE